MNTDNKNNLREGFHHVEILLDNKPESIKKIYLPLERSDDRIEKLKEKHHMSLKSIADKLNALGIKTHRGSTFSSGSIHSILKRKKERDKERLMKKK